MTRKHIRVTLIAALVAAALAPASYAAETASALGHKVAPAPVHKNSTPVGAVPAGQRSYGSTDEVDQNTKPHKAKSGKAQAPATLSTVTVVGLRQSLESAESIKQNSRMIVDDVQAESIGKLPDNSVAAALQRIPGVQVAPDFQSEISSVVVRGLPDVVTTLNGRDIFSGDGRQFAFQNLPATAVKGLKVYKTSNASLLDGGIAGVINMELWRPFDFRGKEVAATLTGTHSKFGGHTDPNASLLLSNRWHTQDGDVGALVNFSYMQQHYDYNAVWGDVPALLAQNGGGGRPIPIGNPIRTTTGDLIATPNALGADYNLGDRKRPEFNYAVQWAPNDDLMFYAEGLYDWDHDNYDQPFFFTDYRTVFNGTVNPTGLKLSNTCYADQFTGSPYEGQTVCDANGAVWSGDTYAATSTQVHHEYGGDHQNAVGVKWTGARLALSSDLSATGSSFQTDTFIIDTFLRSPITTLWAGVHGNHQVWSLAGNPATDPANFYFNGLFQNWGNQRGKQYAWRGDGVYNVNGDFLENVEFGVYLADHRSRATGSTSVSTPPPWGLGDISENPNPEDQVVAHFPTGYFCAMPETGALPVRWLTGCYDTLYRNEASLREMYGLSPGQPPIDPGNTFNITERDYDGYVQLDFANEVFGMPWQALVGMRYERVKRNLDAFSFNSNTGVYTPIGRRTSAPVYLPNFSFNLDLRSDLILQLDAARTLTYPAFPSLDPSISLNPGTINRAGAASSGNPDLSPIRSKNYDAALSWYFSPSGYVSGAIFYRKIHGFLQNFVTDVTILGQPFQLSEPFSSGSGFLDGAELSYQQFLTFLPGAWDGIGLQVNYTRVNGDTKQPEFLGGPTDIAPLQGVSKNNGNVVLMYEKYGISARLAYDYRSRYIDGFNQPNPAGIFDEVQLPNQVDFSVSYQFAKDWTAILSATNLTHQVLHQYWGVGNSRPRDIRYTDQTIALGVRFKM